MSERTGARPGERYYAEDGRAICGAQLANKPVGTWCHRSPLKGRTRCAKHGGKAPLGKANPLYKTGKYSRYSAPHNLQGRMDRALADPEFMSLRPELAMIDAMLADRWERIESGSNEDQWEKAIQQFVKLRSAIASGNVQRMRSAIEEMQYILDTGNNEAQARKELIELIKNRKALAESMQNTVVKLNQTVTVEQTLHLLQRVIGVVEDTVTDRKQVGAVMRQVAALTEIQVPGASDG